MSGRGSVQNGHAAEDAALALYAAGGAELLARRWRCREGEIDLVLRDGATIVFVEVKARRRQDVAAGPVSPAQWRRLHAAASRFLAEATDGTSDSRFDVVLVDRTGHLERIENAMSFDGW